MARYQVGTNIILADAAFMQSQYPEGGYTLITEPVLPQPKETKLTKLEFQLRFTFNELVTIEVASATNPGVRVLQKQQQVAEFIDLTDPNTQLGIMYLVSQGLLTHDRGTEILTP